MTRLFSLMSLRNKINCKMRTFRYFVIMILILLWNVNVFAQNKSKAALDYIEKYKDVAMREMLEYKIPASVTLAQGLLESRNGNSKLAKKSNNHFGIKCHKDWKGKRTYHDDDEKGECFRVYKTPEESYRDHSKFLSNEQRYESLFKLKITDYKGWAKGLKNAGYATSSTYANSLINLIERYDLTQYDDMVVKGKFKYKEGKNKKTKEKKSKEKKVKDKGQKEMEQQDDKIEKPKQEVDNAVIYVPFKITETEVVDKTSDGRYIRVNNNVKFIYAKEGESVYDLATMLGLYDYQIIKYNNLGKRTTTREDEIIYIEPKKNKAMRPYKYHTIQKGETLSYVSRLYAVKLKSIFKMNDMDEKTVLQVGDNIRLR